MNTPTQEEFEAAGFVTLSPIPGANILGHYVKYFLANDETKFGLHGIVKKNYTTYEAKFHKLYSPDYTVKLEDPNLPDLAAIVQWFTDAYESQGCCTEEAQLRHFASWG
jgi:hypothetical protein